MAREEPGSCGHNEAHYTVDLDCVGNGDDSGVDGGARLYYYECPECGIRGPLSRLKVAKGAFYSKVGRVALEAKLEVSGRRHTWPPEWFLEEVFGQQLDEQDLPA